jgi:hypothetical protein
MKVKKMITNKFCPQCGNRDCLIDCSKVDFDSDVVGRKLCWINEECADCKIDPSLCPKHVIDFSKPHKHCFVCGCTLWEEAIPEEEDPTRFMFSVRRHFIMGFGVWRETKRWGENNTYIQPFSISLAYYEDRRRRYYKMLEDPNINPKECYLTEWDHNRSSVKIIFGEPCYRFLIDQHINGDNFYFNFMG